MSIELNKSTFVIVYLFFNHGQNVTLSGWIFYLVWNWVDSGDIFFGELQFEILSVLTDPLSVELNIFQIFYVFVVDFKIYLRVVLVEFESKKLVG